MDVTFSTLLTFVHFRCFDTCARPAGVATYGQKGEGGQYMIFLPGNGHGDVQSCWHIHARSRTHDIANVQSLTNFCAPFLKDGNGT